MITKYNKYIVLKEEQEFGGNKASKNIGGLLKKLLGGLVQNVKDELKKPLNDFNNKISKQKNIDDKIKSIVDYLKIHQDTLNSTLNDVNTLPSLKNTFEDNIRTIYTSIKSSIENINNNNFTFIKIFNDVPNMTKKLFTNGDKQFDKNVDSFTTDLILNFGKQYKFTKDDLEKTEEDVNSELEQDQINQAEGNETNMKNYTDNLIKLKEDIKKWFGNIIYKNINNSLNNLKNDDKNTLTIQQEIEKIPNEITQNKDSIKTIINKLINSDKETIKQVRDTLGINKNDALI